MTKREKWGIFLALWPPVLALLIVIYLAAGNLGWVFVGWLVAAAVAIGSMFLGASLL